MIAEYQGDVALPLTVLKVSHAVKQFIKPIVPLITNRQ
jgi:hypothetical protein